MPEPRVIARLRRALLLLLVLLVGGLGGLYYFGTARQRRTPKVADASEHGIPGEDVKVAGKDFQYRLEDGGKVVFAIRGKSYELSRSQEVRLENLEITTYSPSGEPYQVQGDRAIFNQASDETELSGNVLVKGPLGMELRAESLRMTDKGRLILSQQPVSFRYLDTAQGTSERLRFDLQERLFVLGGRTFLESRPSAPAPFTVESGRIFLDRNRHHARADFDVRVRYGSHRIKAGRFNLWLSEDDSKVQFVRALFAVQGRVGLEAVEGSGVGPVRFSGESLSAVLAPDAKSLERFELAGGKGQSAVLLTETKPQPPHRLAAGYITGDLNEGRLVKAEALGGVRLAELTALPPEPAWDEPAGEAASEAAAVTEEDLADAEAGGDPGAPVGANGGVATDEVDRSAVRLVVAERAEAGFSQDGGLGEVVLFDKVVFRDPGFTVHALEGRFDFVNGLGEFFGKPALLDSQRGKLTAPRLLYTQRTGLLYAEGGTRTELPPGSAPGSLAASPLGKGEETIWVEAEEAFLRDKPRSFLYRGSVRAWRGEDLILADELKGDDVASVLTGTGHVRTVWSSGQRSVASGDTTGPVEVLADAMTYARAAGKIVYTGHVRSTQQALAAGQTSGRSLSCEELTIRLSAAQRAESLTCVGKVKIEDRVAGRTLEGDRAHYELAGRTVVVDGEKVLLRERGGAEVSGRRMTYEFGSGKVEIGGEVTKEP